jgi:protoheme IX farnesyltransferase
MLVLAGEFPKRNPVRTGAVFSSFFMITEALVGAALVKFQWVAQDVSIGRVVSITVHLINTLLLLASLSLTAWWASGGNKPNIQRHKTAFIGLSIAILSLLILGVSGAITALGDTLFLLSH